MKSWNCHTFLKLRKLSEYVEDGQEGPEEKVPLHRIQKISMNTKPNLNSMQWLKGGNWNRFFQLCQQISPTLKIMDESTSLEGETMVHQKLRFQFKCIFTYNYTSLQEIWQ